jgi:hypothetical protein
MRAAIATAAEARVEAKHAVSTNSPGTRPGMTNSARKLPYFASTGSGGTLSLGALACMVISFIETRS